jgi:hypothetical protein
LQYSQREQLFFVTDQTQLKKKVIYDLKLWQTNVTFYAFPGSIWNWKPKNGDAHFDWWASSNAWLGRFNRLWRMLK